MPPPVTDSTEPSARICTHARTCETIVRTSTLAARTPPPPNEGVEPRALRLYRHLRVFLRLSWFSLRSAIYGERMRMPIRMRLILDRAPVFSSQLKSLDMTKRAGVRARARASKIAVL